MPSSTYLRVCLRIDAGDWDNARICRTDNASVTYYMDSNGQYELEAADRTAVQTALNNEFAPTDLTITYDSTPVFSGASETDIVYQEGDNIPADAMGITWCDDEVDGTVYDCDQQFIRIRGSGAYNPIRTCHESGHAVGLMHGAESYPIVDNLDSRLGCMRTPTSAITSGDLGGNQVWHINHNY